MAQAPPTPPPTTDAEIMDEVRFAAAGTQSSAASGTASGRSDVYTARFDLIKDLALAGNLAEMLNFAQEADVQGKDEASATHFLIIVPLVLGYLIEGSLPAARHTLTSLPRGFHNTPLWKALITLVASVTEKKFAHVYVRANELKAIPAAAGFQLPQLSPVVTVLVDRFIEDYRNKTSTLVSNAFTSIPVTIAQSYLGLDSATVLTGAQQAGWSYDAGTKMLFPKPQTSAKSKQANASTLNAFNFIADSVCKLEV
ncbi:hypothetical protein DL96DRAFT_1604588 [Flagelloscypha sp. PMI_526]|nr:hypothetical protein DL96DRAFT_1604588 [Flagelloscypha sp. PMI_526]